MTDLERAKDIITDFLEREYGDTWEEDFSDLSRIDLACETSEDDLTDTVARADLIACRIDTLLNYEILVRRQQFGSLREMIDKALLKLDVQELTRITDAELEGLERRMMAAFEQSMKKGKSDPWKNFNAGIDR